MMDKSCRNNVKFLKTFKNASVFCNFSIGYDPRTLSDTPKQYSHHLAERQHISMINFEKNGEKTNLKKRPIDGLWLYLLDDKENRTHIDLTPVDWSSSSSPSKVLQPNQINPDKEISFPVVSSQLSPSTAVRSIVTNLFR